MSDVSGLLSLYNLLTRASNVSCSKGASAFLSLPSTEDVRFSLAIDGFIPVLQNRDLQIPQRILAAFVLHALYASHDHLNPFHDHLLHIFESERAIAVAALRIKSSLVGLSQRGLESPHDHNAMHPENEQLIWVLWKILQGEGDDLALYSPNVLSRMTIPEHLQPLHLNVHGGSGHGGRTHINPRRSPTEFSQPNLGLMGPPTSHNSILFQTKNPSSVSGPFRAGSAPRFLSSRTPSTSEFSPVDATFPASSGIYNQTTSQAQENQVDQSLQRSVSKEPFKRHPQSQPSPDPLGLSHGYINSSTFSDQTHNKVQGNIGSISQLSHNQSSKVTGNQQLQTLPGRFFEASYVQSDPDSLLGTYNHSDTNNQTGTSTKLLNEPSRVEQRLQHSTSVLPRVPTLSNVGQRSVQNHLRNLNITSEDACSFTSVASDTKSNTRPRLDPISRPYPNTLSSHTTLDSPAAAPAFEIFSVDGRVPRPDITPYDRELPQESLMRMNNVMQQAPGIPFAQQKRTPTPTRVSPPTRSPGVIGSGRPSASASKNDTIVDHNTSRWSQIGIIGNGRPESSVVAKDGSLANRGMEARRGHESMIPFSVLRMRTMKEESEKREHSIIGQPESDLGDDNRRRSIGQTDARTSLLEKLTTLSIERKAQEPPQEADIAPFKPAVQALERNWPPSQDNSESIPIHTPSVTLQHQAMPLPSHATTFRPHSVGTAVSADQNTNETATASPLHPSSASPSTPTTELCEFSENSQPSPFSTSKKEETSETHINEKERDELSHAIFLLLSARERVLTLTEQRMLQPHLSTLAQPLSLLRPGDIPPLVAKNTDIAAKLLLFLLDRNDEDAERIERVVRDASKNSLIHTNHGSLDVALPLPAAASIDSMAAVDAIQAMIRFVNTCGVPSNSIDSNDISPFGGREAKEGYLDAIRKLPPTMQSFNLIAKLLRPTHHKATTSEHQDDSPEIRVATLIQTEVLGGFMSGCVGWIEHAEREEKEGEVYDNRVAIAIASLCRFYTSLLKHGFVSAASEADTTEMMSFALQFSRFEEARSLYSTLAAART